MEKIRNQKWLIKKEKKNKNKRLKKKHCVPVFAILVAGLTLTSGAGLLLKKMNLFTLNRTSESKNIVKKGVLSAVKKPTEVKEVAQELYSKNRFSEITVSRSLIGEPIVHVREKTPIAMVKIDNEFRYVDAQGVVLDNIQSRENFYSVPVITGLTEEDIKASNGHSRLKEAVKVIDVFSAYSEKENWSEIHFDNQYAWVIHAYNPQITYIVGEKDFSKKAKRMLRVMNKFNRNKDVVKTVDLDFEDRVVVKFKREVVNG